jgi:hypothetical protein
MASETDRSNGDAEDRISRMRREHAEMLAMLRAMVKRHDQHAAQDNPCPPGESGTFRCGCLDCRNALDILSRMVTP